MTYKKDLPVEISIRSMPAETKNGAASEENQYYRIEINDNGIGIDGEQTKNIFQPFVRLNPKSEYNGSGLGLALCEKIVKNHGGTIYAEGIENSGTRIILILPANP
jgi:signal transduction histidine kinase